MNIFVTVGTQKPFDRMVRTVMDALKDVPYSNVFYQVGEGSTFALQSNVATTLLPEEYELRFNESDAVIAHAGMGVIIKARLSGKPIFVMARSASLGEHRSEHQADILEYLRKFEGIVIFNSASDLSKALTHRQYLNPEPATASQLPGLLQNYLLKKYG